MASDWEWFALQTLPGREFAARAGLIDPDLMREEGLKEGDLHVVLPIRHKLRVYTSRRATDRRTRRSLIARPRIPGYLLLGIQPDAPPVWKHVLTNPFVVGVLGHAGEPQPVSDTQLLIAMLDDLRTLMRKGRRNKPRPIEIANGPYQGRQVSVVEINGADPEISGLFA